MCIVTLHSARASWQEWQSLNSRVHSRTTELGSRDSSQLGCNHLVEELGLHCGLCQRREYPQARTRVSKSSAATIRGDTTAEGFPQDWPTEIRRGEAGPGLGRSRSDRLFGAPREPGVCCDCRSNGWSWIERRVVERRRVAEARECACWGLLCGPAGREPANCRGGAGGS